MNIKAILILFLPAAFIFGLAASCSGPQYPKEIASLDSTLVQLDSAEKNLQSLDSVKIFSAIESIDKDMHYIQVHFSRVSKDSLMDRETATFLTDYRSVLKPLKLYKREHRKLSSDIDYSQLQITNLKRDLEKGLVEEKDVQQYVETERTEAHKTIQTTKKIVDIVSQLMPRYDSAEPKVRQYVDGLKAKDSTAVKQ